MVLTFLTPQLPPAVCGVGDHTVSMAAALREIVPSVTAVHLLKGCDHQSDVFDQIDFWDREPKSLGRILKKHRTDVLWIQYSGYGFGYQGIPWYLSRALKAITPRPQVVVFFHEIHCSRRQLGWKGLIISPIQKQIAKSLARRADLVLASADLYLRHIQTEYCIPQSRIRQLCLGSNISIQPYEAADRNRWRNELGWRPHERIAIAFGSNGSQRKALLRNQDALLSAIDADTIQRVACIGGNVRPARDEVLRGIHPRIVEATIVTGHRPEHEVAKMLVAADVGLMAYPFERYGKSGVFMAYSLAGLPVLTDPDAAVCDTVFRSAWLLSRLQFVAHPTLIDNVAARIARHRDAMSLYSWGSLAHQAFGWIEATSHRSADVSPA